MSLTAVAPDPSRPRATAPKLFWFFSLVIAPIAAVLTAYAMSGEGQHWGLAIAFTAALYAALYAAISRFAGIEPRRAFGGYLLAALVSVPWGYGLLIAALIYSCESGNQCLS